MRLPIIRPDVTFEEVAGDIRSILESGRLTQGPYVERLEALVAEHVRVRHAVATTSATTALHLALAAAGIGPGDEVLVADFSFPATANVVVQLGATPVFVDCAPGSFALDVEDVARKWTDRSRAIMPVDPFGQPADMPALVALAADRGAVVVEDAACALGARSHEAPCGGFEGMGCFSFHPRKVVTTGEGGMVTTDDDDLAARLRLLRNHGGRATEAVGLTFVECGFNYRLSEISAAVGLAQLNRLGAILADRAATAMRYDSLLASLDGVEVRTPAAGDTWSYQSYVVVLDDAIDRDQLVRRLADRDIETTLGTYAMHAQPAFARFGYAPGDLPISWRSQNQSLTLPLLPSMDPADVDRVVDALAQEVAAS